MKLGRYMTVERVPASHDAFLIYDRGGHVLATIEWYARWRCYVVSPDSLAVLSAECLRVLADFCEQQGASSIESGAT